MSTHRTEWPCCGDVSETQSWVPSACPFCSPPSRTPEDVQTLLAAAALIENPRVILPDDKALAAKLRAMAGEQT